MYYIQLQQKQECEQGSRRNCKIYKKGEKKKKDTNYKIKWYDKITITTQENMLFKQKKRARATTNPNVTKKEYKQIKMRGEKWHIIIITIAITKQYIDCMGS